MAGAAAGAAVGTVGRAAVLPRFFYHVFAAEGPDDRASFLLSNMKHLDFQGVFLINKRLFLSTERRRPGRGAGGSPGALRRLCQGGTGSSFST